MAVTKDIVCPHCKKANSYLDGFEHDAELNFICFSCRKVIFGVTPQAEAEMKLAIGPQTASGTMGFHNNWKKEPLPIRLTTVPDESVSEGSSIASESEPDLEQYNCYC